MNTLTCPLAALIVQLLLAGCVEQQGAEPARPAATREARPAAAGGDRVGLRTSQQVARALQEAQAAYMDGRHGDAVLRATAVIEGAASPEEYYDAVKILGLASCARKDPRPVSFAYKRLEPADREGLRSACEASGLMITDQGVVTSAP